MRYQVVYGDPSDSQYAVGNDKPLPIELINRISIWVKKNSGDQEGFKERLLTHSSMNAFVRAEIAAGNI